MTKTRLNEVYKDGVMGNGIFTDLNILPVPWKDDNIHASLDAEYYGNISGDKLISPLLQRYLQKSETDALTQPQRDALAVIAYSLYNKNWEKLFHALQLEYNPIENYSMTESGQDIDSLKYGHEIEKTDSTETSNTQNTETEKTDNNTRIDNLENVRTPNLSASQQNFINGFNSSSSVPSGDMTQSQSGNETTTNTGTQTNNGTSNETISRSDAGTISAEGKETHKGIDETTKDHTLQRSGNIGVTTTQQMLQSEIELRRFNFFHDVVFRDIDKLLTIDVY